MRNTVGIAVVLVSACAGPRVGDDVVGMVVATEWTAWARFDNRPERSDETVEGACRAWTVRSERGGPADLSVGLIRLEGLREEVTLEYDELGGHYIASPTSFNLYIPEWDALASAPGDEVDGFALNVGALEQFVDPVDGQLLPPFTGTPVEVTWTPAAPADPEALVELAGSVGLWHAGTDGRRFECVGSDTGSLTIGPLISAELAAWGGWGSAQLSRFHEVVQQSPGYDVRFRIATTRWITFDD